MTVTSNTLDKWWDIYMYLSLYSEFRASCESKEYCENQSIFDRVVTKSVWVWVFFMTPQT